MLALYLSLLVMKRATDEADQHATEALELLPQLLPAACRCGHGLAQWVCGGGPGGGELLPQLLPAACRCELCACRGGEL